MTQTPEITKFDGKYGFLSNFYPAEIEAAPGIVVPTLEHGYHYRKAATDKGRAAILACETAAQAKRKGRDIVMRDDWDEIKIDIMLDLLRLKFAIPQLRRDLLATHDAWIVEGNNWNDVFWGVCRGRGKNHLGVLLMAVRDEIRRAS